MGHLSRAGRHAKVGLCRSTYGEGIMMAGRRSSCIASGLSRAGPPLPGWVLAAYVSMKHHQVAKANRNGPSVMNWPLYSNSSEEHRHDP